MQNGKLMVDRLKRSLEQLDLPNCPNCNIEMKWSRSMLVDATTIVHVFICHGCSRITETTSTVSSANIPHEKLSAPRHRHAA
jgi:hypothetical protein